MNKRIFLLLMSLVFAVAVFSVGLARSVAQSPPTTDTENPAEVCKNKMRCITPQMREAAAARAAAARQSKQNKASKQSKVSKHNKKVRAAALVTPTPTLDQLYFGTYPNYANSPTTIQKFIDPLPVLCDPRTTVSGCTGTKYIPLAVPDQATYPGSDYYEIALVEYTEQMHSSLLPTILRGYVQLQTPANIGAAWNKHIPLIYPDGSPIYYPNTTTQVIAADNPHYLGPVIVASGGSPAQAIPVRVKFYNLLPLTAGGGNLFIPVDTTIMGAGMGSLPNGCTPGVNCEMYTQNRATLHLHGGNTPWISDGTPHQWTTPAGEVTSYPKGVSAQNVPDMPDPGDGALTFFYTNQQSARLMFYHDHAYGITRLNVYAGEAAGYLLTDPAEQALIPGVIPADQIPLIIQDKTFIDPTKIAAQDPTWPFALNPARSDLWFPHIYMPNQNPADPMGVNAMGRWDYGPWFWPPVTAAAGLVNGEVPCPTALRPNQTCPGTPLTSLVPEAFMDTPVVNGAAYPTVTLQPKQYRLRILNASNDRSLHLGLYYAVNPLTYVPPSYNPATLTYTPAVGVCNPGTVNCTEVGTVPAVPHPALPVPPLTPAGQVAIPLCSTASSISPAGLVNAVIDTTINMPMNGTGEPMNGTGPAGNCWPTSWPTDGRDGGVPDPSTAGPALIQIGTEGGLNPAPAAIPSTPIGYDYNRRSIVVLNILNKGIYLGPAERADVVVDLSTVPSGSTLLLYNDAPAPTPAFDPRYDYYTGDPDQSLTGNGTGGAPTTLAGYGPNTRTIMQIVVSGTVSPKNSLLTNLQANLPTVFNASQPALIVPSGVYSRIQDTSLTYGGTSYPMLPKAIQELFELDYGRMNATLGVELPFTNFNIQTTIPLGYVDPVTEILNDGQQQIWKITHNGVDTHAIHFHLFNVQLINRVGWDGQIRPPDPNEVGWKDTVRMNPLEDAIVALKPLSQTLSFGIPNSVRLLDPTMLQGATLTLTNPVDGNLINVPNNPTDFGWEYVWHCHLLGHEENDMMRPMVFRVPTSYSLSGTVTLCGTGMPGVTVTLGASNAVTTTDASGNYTFSLLSHGNYTVTPSLTGQIFTPVNRNITINNANGTVPNFAVNTHSISGQITRLGPAGTIIPVAGATVTLGGAASATTTTNASGNYTFNCLLNGVYTLTPSLTGQTFTPAAINPVNISGADVINQNFTVNTYSITGTVTVTGVGTPVAGATIALTGFASLSTNTIANGTYTFNGLLKGNYTVTPSMAGGTFTPTNRVVNLTGNSTGQNFTMSNGSIVPSITVISPNTNMGWRRGFSHMIQWTYTGNPGNLLKIELLQRGLVVSTITTTAFIGNGISGFYSWFVPSTQAVGGYTIRLTSTTYPAVTAVSNTFYIFY